MLRDLERRGLVAQRPRVGDREPDLLVSLAKPDLAGFDAEEISLVEAMTRALCFDQRSTIAFRDAHDTILGAARLGEVIPYFTVFSGRPAETSAADLAWAIRESERRKAAKVPAPAEAPTGRLRAAVDGLLWHLLRDPSLGASLPAGGRRLLVRLPPARREGCARAGPRLRLPAGSRRAGAGRDQGGGGRRRGRGR